MSCVIKKQNETDFAICPKNVESALKTEIVNYWRALIHWQNHQLYWSKYLGRDRKADSKVSGKATNRLHEGAWYWVRANSHLCSIPSLTVTCYKYLNGLCQRRLQPGRYFSLPALSVWSLETFWAWDYICIFEFKLLLVTSFVAVSSN